MPIGARLRDIGQRAYRAFRLGRVWLWRFKRDPVRRDRAAAMATFAFIGAFAIGSVDAIVTGGADFDPGTAYAMDYPQREIVAPAPAMVAEAPPEAVNAAAAAAVDYSVATEELLGGPEPIFADYDEPRSNALAADGGKPIEAREPVAGSEPRKAAL